jgi:integrase
MSDRWARATLGRILEPGIRKTVSGWQVYLKRDGQMLSKHFPAATDIRELRRWREQQIGRRMANVAPLLVGVPTFAEDVRRYLELITGLVTYQNRVGWLRAWQQALGHDTVRADVTAFDIRRVLEQWRRKGLKPATLNLRLAVLRHLYTTLDGKSAPNPVRDVQPYADPFKRWQLPAWPDALAAVEAIPSAVTRQRLRVFLWTGLPPSQLKQLRPAHFHPEQQRLDVPGRKKGAGTPDTTLPLLPQAVTALTEFFAHAAYKGTWHNSTLGRGLTAGCIATNITPFRVYALRHIFGTMVATIVKDDRAVAALLQHASLQMTQRYTASSVAPRVQSAMDAVRKAHE